jgi:hypothetical protein
MNVPASFYLAQIGFNDIWNWAAVHYVWAPIIALFALPLLIGGIMAATEKYGAYTWYFIVTVVMGAVTVSGGNHLFFFVFILGMLTAFAEIIGKFPDEPIKSLKTTHALCYHVFNGLIAMLALYILELADVAHKTELDQVKIVAVAGLGAMMVMRSKLFSVKVGNEEVSVGPDQVIKIFFNFMEDAIDRVRAQSRIEFVKENLANLRFDRISDYSTTMLLAAQALDKTERDAAVERIEKLRTDKPEDQELKSYRLGFYLLNLMGENFVAKLFADAPPAWMIRVIVPDKKGFSLNPFAKKGETTFWYFAYDMHMAKANLLDVFGLQEMDDKAFEAFASPKPAKLRDYKLVFDAPDSDGPGAEGLPNITQSPTDEVEGVLYQLPDVCDDFLKRVRSDYLPVELPVFELLAKEDSEPIQALVYRAKTPREGLKPKKNVVESLVEAAGVNDLSKPYVEKLRTLVPPVPVPPVPVPPVPIEIASLTPTASKKVKVTFAAVDALPPSEASLLYLVRGVETEMGHDTTLDTSALASGIEIGPFESNQTIAVQIKLGAGASAVHTAIKEIKIS